VDGCLSTLQRSACLLSDAFTRLSVTTALGKLLPIAVFGRAEYKHSPYEVVSRPYVLSLNIIESVASRILVCPFTPYGCICRNLTFTIL
jgi:hypothetical protein